LKTRDGQTIVMPSNTSAAASRRVRPVIANSSLFKSTNPNSVKVKNKHDEMEHMQDVFKGLWKSGQFSDFTITAGSKEFKVHKCVVGSRSAVFTAIFENDMKEKQTGKMEIIEYSAVLPLYRRR
jgi:BTB/POZ domain